jgi:hypothetical protein
VKQARDGAKALLDILPIGCGAACQTQVAIVPFRGCYSNNNNRYNAVPIASEPAPFNANPHYGIRGCTIQNEVMSLSANRTALKNHLDTFSAPGGWPGTNICAGMHEGYSRLTGAGAQAGARKVMVVLTDGDNRYSDGASNSTRGNGPVPGVYNTGTWTSGQGSGSLPANCRPSGPNYNSASGWDAPEADQRVNTMDVGTYNYAETLRSAGVEVYVLRYAAPAGDLPAGTACDPALIGPVSASSPNRNPSNEARDQNLARCIADDLDHYFYAATAQDIPTMFTFIAQSIATRLIE